MREFEILIRPDASALSLGGQSAPRHGGDKATARDALGRLTIPASALRGGLRIELERLLRARDGVDAVCAVNPESPGPSPCGCQACRLFGEPGRALGTLRLEDAVLEGNEPLSLESHLRPGVAVSRRTGTAVSRHLTLTETSEPLNFDGDEVVFRARGRLVPRGFADGDESLDEDWRNLDAACAALQALGGGKARGLGWVQCSLGKRPAPETRVPSRPSSEVHGLTLRFEALAPLHFGRGRPLGFFQPTLKHAPGSTVRGALAYALLESNLVKSDDPRFQRLFGSGSPASFGSARVRGEIPSATRRRCRPNDHVFDDLIGELLRHEAARAGLALALGESGVCPAADCHATKLLPWPKRLDSPGLLARVRTRTALNRLTGTAMDRKLYSIEAVEPIALGVDDNAEPLVLSAEVWGLGPDEAELLMLLSDQEVWLGGKRSKGMGRCRLGVEELPNPDSSAARRRVEELAFSLEEGWRSLCRNAGSALRERFLPEGQLPFVVTLQEPWTIEVSSTVLAESLHQGPLADRGLRVIDAFVSFEEEGRFGAIEAEYYRAPLEILRGEEPPRRVAAPGSVYIYAIPQETLETQLDELLHLGCAGTGLHQELGWGRFLIRGSDRDF